MHPALRIIVVEEMADRDRDLEDELAAERTLREILQERADDRERFVAMLAHDLRQPLAVIEMSALFLKRLGCGEQAEQAIHRILAAEAQLDQLAAELLDMGTARFGILERERIDLEALIRECATQAQLTHPDRTVVLALGEPISGHWDKKRLARILQNLVENALAHSDGAVTVRSRKSAADALITVENEADQIDAEFLTALFEPFSRGGPHGRVGLGLFIARELARAHGGDITSSWGSGVIAFTISMPLAEPVPKYDRPRRHPRISFESDLEVAAGERTFWVKGRDISLRGLAFFCDEALPVSQKIRLAVYSEAASFSLMGTVRHAQRGVVGVEFPSDLSQAEVDLLRRQRARRPS
jgi:signal transduction histidine kinase